MIHPQLSNAAAVILLTDEAIIHSLIFLFHVSEVVRTRIIYMRDLEGAERFILNQ